jgi:hypothetical protein
MTARQALRVAFWAFSDEVDRKAVYTTTRYILNAKTGQARPYSTRMFRD